MFRLITCFVNLAALLCTSAWAYHHVNHIPALTVYDIPPVAGYKSIPLPPNAEAIAVGLKNVVDAKATAAKINARNWDALYLYGHEIGYPLLTKKYGPLTSLYSAALPARSFVGKTDPAFLIDSNGKVKFVGESSIGVTAI